MLHPLRIYLSIPEVFFFFFEGVIVASWSWFFLSFLSHQGLGAASAVVNIEASFSEDRSSEHCLILAWTKGKGKTKEKSNFNHFVFILTTLPFSVKRCWELTDFAKSTIGQCRMPSKEISPRIKSPDKWFSSKGHQYNCTQMLKIHRIDRLLQHKGQLRRLLRTKQGWIF